MLTKRELFETAALATVAVTTPRSLLAEERLAQTTAQL
jgi:hypothetical protein